MAAQKSRRTITAAVMCKMCPIEHVPETRALLGDPSKFPLEPSVLGFVVHVRKVPRNLPNRIPTHLDLLHRISPELVAGIEETCRSVHVGDAERQGTW